MLGIHATTKAFFTAEKVMRAVDRATRQSLSRFGAFVRSDARHSIRKRKKASAPGQPPTSRTGLLKRHIYFAYDATKKSVVIGAARLNGVAGEAAPRVLEHGGTVGVKRRFGSRVVRRLGQTGEIRVGGPPGRSTKNGITYARLNTPAQVRRANQINRHAYGPEGGQTILRLAGLGKINLSPRPYMKPAFDKNRRKAVEFFRKSVRPAGGGWAAAYARAKGRE